MWFYKVWGKTVQKKKKRWTRTSHMARLDLPLKSYGFPSSLSLICPWFSSSPSLVMEDWIPAITLPRPRLFLAQTLSLSFSLSLSSSFFLTSPVATVSLFLPLSSTAAPFTIQETNSRCRPCTRALRPEHAEGTGANSVCREMLLFVAVRMTNRDVDGAQMSINDHFLWRSLVPSCSTQLPLQDETLHSWRKCLDRCTHFCTKTVNFASGSEPNEALFSCNDLEFILMEKKMLSNSI